MLCWAFDFITVHISWHTTIHGTIEDKQVCEVSEESDIPTTVICGLTKTNIWYSPEKWQLFIDSFMHSLKAALLHKGNALPSFHCLCRPQKGNIQKHEGNSVA
jgi:hypothetical protein